DQRKPEPSYFWGDTNYNDVGTIEFLQLCEVLDSEPMLVVNLFHPEKRFKSASHREHGFDLPNITDTEAGIQLAADWVAYCNAEAGAHPMADLRKRHGYPEPFGVQYWELDNEGNRWFSPDDYARMCVRYAKAMKAIDPTIKLGMTSYGFKIGRTTYGPDGDQLERMLDIAGNDIDFLAGRVCIPENIEWKVGAVRKWNAEHEHKLFYADTEAVQQRDQHLDSYTAMRYKRAGYGKKEPMRTWTYALTLASNLMAFQRCGSDARFMCFNNLANTMGQSCIETPKEDVILTGNGYILELLSRSEAAWPLVIDAYEAAQTDIIQVQAAWNAKRDKVAVYLLNRGPADGQVTLDVAALGRGFTTMTRSRLWAGDALTQETVKRQGNVKKLKDVKTLDAAPSIDVALPRFSFTEIVLD
ncbi:MAG: hypothetical protein KAJ19_13675, partial [Gammaproteobacteria bacterium]|nr:hypothetical protein [Gammaproteobacteria bacterium]